MARNIISNLTDEDSVMFSDRVYGLDLRWVGERSRTEAEALTVVFEASAVHFRYLPQGVTGVFVQVPTGWVVAMYTEDDPETWWATAAPQERVTRLSHFTRNCLHTATLFHTDVIPERGSGSSFLCDMNMRMMMIRLWVQSELDAGTGRDAVCMFAGFHPDPLMRQVAADELNTVSA